ncbi:MAG: EamA family transporter, partial [Sphingobacteriales bacterium]|nr:EamA family transporter [Sphingobacteriales bacterium]
YFFIQALNKSGLVSASVFAVNHIGIVLFSIFVSLLFFREKLRWYNWIGIVLCIFAVLLLTMNHEIHT